MGMRNNSYVSRQHNARPGIGPRLSSCQVSQVSQVLSLVFVVLGLSVGACGSDPENVDLTGLSQAGNASSGDASGEPQGSLAMSSPVGQGQRAAPRRFRGRRSPGWARSSVVQVGRLLEARRAVAPIPSSESGVPIEPLPLATQPLTLVPVKSIPVGAQCQTFNSLEECRRRALG